MSRAFNLSALVRQDLQNAVPYDAPFYADVVKLDANENPHHFPQEVLDKIFKEINT